MIPHDQQVIQRALIETDLVRAARRVVGWEAATRVESLEVAFVAQGGAMRVYRMTLESGRGSAPVALKLARSRYLAHRPMSELAFPEPADGDHDEALIRLMVDTARWLNRVAPGLYPRLGGYWRWQEDGLPVRLLAEEFVAGRALDRCKYELEQDFLAHRLDYVSLQKETLALERQGFQAYLRLWQALGRQAFTLDATPWNVVQCHNSSSPSAATILDLHHLTAHADPVFVLQRLLAGFGMREETVKQALLPAYLDTFGRTEGRRLLRAVADELETQENGTGLGGLSLYGRVREAIDAFLVEE